MEKVGRSRASGRRSRAPARTLAAAAPAPWHLQRLGIDQLHAQGIRGAGTTIAVVDTGIDPSMPIFGGNPRVVTKGIHGSDGIDQDGHGTEMAAIMVGEGIAICPDATVLGISAFASTTWSVTYLVLGIHMAISAGVDVISISGGVPAPDSELDKAVRLAMNEGIVVVAAGSNDEGSAFQYPANIAPAISVTSSNPQSALVLPVPPGVDDIAAPGIGIATVQWDKPVARNGTSHATAIVSAISALLLGAVPPARRKALGAQLRGFLRATARPASNSGGPNHCGIVQPVAALAQIKSWL